MDKLTITLKLASLVAANVGASKEETHYYLRGVCLEITPKGVTYVATDGHVLFAQHVTSEPQIPPASYIIPSDVIERARKWVKPSVLADAEVDLEIGDGLDARLSGAGSSIAFKFIDGTYPNWRGIVPTKTSGAAPQRINGAHIVRAQNFAHRALGIDPVDQHNANVSQYYWNGEGPLVITFAPHAAFALVMPMRGNSGEYVRPEWL